MRSGKKFTKPGRPTKLQQAIDEKPPYLPAASRVLVEAVDKSLQHKTAAYQSWLTDARLDGIGIGATKGRIAGGEAIRLRAEALQDYIRRHHSHMLQQGNFSDIARRIIRAEAGKENGGWQDNHWINGSCGTVKRYVPKENSLRKLLSQMISGIG